MRGWGLKYHLCFLLILLTGLFANAQLISLNPETRFIHLGKNIELFEDKSAKLSFEDIRKPSYSQKFTLSKEETPNFNMTRSAIWCRFKLLNTSERVEWYLEQMVGSMTNVECFIEYKNSVRKYTKGFFDPFELREPSSLYPTFSIRLPKDSSCTVYVRLCDIAPFSANLNIGKPGYFIKRNHSFDIINGLFFGMMFILMIYNLFIFLSVREPVYIYYMLYIFFVTAFISVVTGYISVLPSFFSKLFGSYAAVTASLFGIFALLFTVNFLELKKNAPRLMFLFYTLCSFVLLASLAAIAGFKRESIIFIQGLGFFLGFFAMISGFSTLKKGYKPAKYYLVAWGVYMLCLVCYILTDMGLLPFNLFTHSTLQIGSAFEAIFLSVALADKLSSFKLEKEIAQKEVLFAAMKNEKLIREQNMILEQKVKERTAEIELQKKVIEIRQKEILDSIHYARRIQQALLPSDRFLEKKLKSN
jgi:hypothetical protein